MRIETINYNNIEHAFPYLAKQMEDVEYEKDIEKSDQWIMKSMHYGFRGKIAFDGFKKPIGTIFYGPLQYMNTPIDANVNVIYLRLLYVAEEKRAGGIGHALIHAMRTDSRSFAGVVAMSDEKSSDMNYTNLELSGFRTVIVQDDNHYMFLPIRADDIKLKISPLKYKPVGVDVEITLFNDGFCPLENHKLRQVQRIARTFGDVVTIRELDLTPSRARQYGTSAVCLVDGQPLGLNAGDEEIREEIQKAVSKRHHPISNESEKTLSN